MTDPHVCTCGDCEGSSFDDRCRFEAQLKVADAALDLVVGWYTGRDKSGLTEVMQKVKALGYGVERGS